MTDRFNKASLAYFRATNFNLPHRIDESNIVDFIKSEINRFSSMPGVVWRLSWLLKDYEGTQ